MVAGTNVPVAPVGTPSTDRVMADWDALLDVDRFSAYLAVPPAAAEREFEGVMVPLMFSAFGATPK